jgi:hypothetical protein
MMMMIILFDRSIDRDLEIHEHTVVDVICSIYLFRIHTPLFYTDTQYYYYYYYFFFFFCRFVLGCARRGDGTCSFFLLFAPLGEKKKHMAEAAPIYC